ncbi:1,2-dihydroxy-3-keto-5-methylthiopentene dioxygenase [Chrysoperla carnea]|uniref:1,2-dihydroxy-3-keto-5-methylthiopentene dioxygenase n=1 Tax=Chrysoperla carnea TaxID=189513 RepID=UPI001D097236|nr:1,2-dihydroxy-3-keto-5-methylthiopentene dioxygenase [Chrysoperla carnea]
MVRAWYLGKIKDDQRLENHRDPEQFIDLKDLYVKSGVEHFEIPVNDYENNDYLQSLRQGMGITYCDEITCSKECMSNYEEKLRIFFEEHLHTDDEIRYVLDGSGYFDVRDANDEWIRIEVTPGDLLIIPAGIYHRFTLDTNNYIKAKRYFVGEPVWTPHNRPADHMECRQEYLEKLQSLVQQ